MPNGRLAGTVDFVGKVKNTDPLKDDTFVLCDWKRSNKFPSMHMSYNKTCKYVCIFMPLLSCF